MDPEQLLSEVAAINRKYDMLAQKTGAHFNIFEIADIATDEVTICRVLHDYLNPKGTHGQGNVYLQLFFEEVLGLANVDKHQLNQARVLREYVIDKQRRIDLLIITPTQSIPIEVKIYATDQDEQCQDYYNYAKNANMYYLTLYGDPPSPRSLGRLTCKTDDNPDGVALISFEQHVLSWLRDCLKQGPTASITPICEITKQLIAILEKLTGQLGEEKEMEVNEILSSSVENMRSAITIASAIKESRTDLLTKLFEAIDREMDKCAEVNSKLDKLADSDGMMREAIAGYYTRSRTYPSIYYNYIENIKPGLDIRFVIQIADRIYAGFYLKSKDGAQPAELTESEIREAIPSLPQERNSTPMLLHWEFLPGGLTGRSPNFNREIPDDNYLNLFEQEYLESFARDCVSHVKGML